MIELALIGTPNAGKSTFFKAATLKDVRIADYPFTTLEPNEGFAHVTIQCPCKTLGTDCKKCIAGIRFVPVKLWDVAGLVPGAHEGRGRGNAFLSDLMQAAAFIHVIDASGMTDLEGNPATNFNPAHAIDMLESELDHWLLNLIKKDWNQAKIQGGIPELFAKRVSGLGITKEHIAEAWDRLQLPARLEQWSDNDALRFVHHLRQNAKPSIVAANKLDKANPQTIEHLKEKFPGKKILPVSADLELALREATKHGLISYVPGAGDFTIPNPAALSEKQSLALARIKNFLIAHRTTNVQHVLNTIIFDILHMIAVFPVENEQKFSNKQGDVLPDCLLLRKGATPRDLAFAIHQDIGQKFISAVNARTKRTIASDAPLQHEDIISIRAGR